MSRIFGSLALLAAGIAGGVYYYDLDTDGAKYDQICVAESAEEP
jgi:hypothetical protein